MLKDKSSSAIIAVRHLATARDFYSKTLGLEIEQEMGEQVLVYKTGNTHLVIYQSEHAGTNKANAAVWSVGDEVDAIAADLKSKGVEFEHYSDIGATFDGDVHVFGDMRLLWLQDPDGNILHFNNM